MVNLDDWHSRFIQQSHWTSNIRNYLFSRAGLNKSVRVLEVGCGTGAILEQQELNSIAYGLDIDYARVEYAKRKLPSQPLVCGNAYRLPYPDRAFDIVFSHFLFLWLNQPAIAMQEMVRVTRPGGMVIAAAEPDYGGRIDYPEHFEKIGRLQTESLRIQGANPSIGRKLSHLFSTAGLQDIETGVLQGSWSRGPSKTEWDTEWKTIINDIAGKLSINEIHTLKDYDWDAWQNNTRVMFVPTFYAIGTRG